MSRAQEFRRQVDRDGLLPVLEAATRRGFWRGFWLGWSAGGAVGLTLAAAAARAWL